MGAGSHPFNSPQLCCARGCIHVFQPPFGGCALLCCVALQVFLEVWGEGSSWEELFQAIRAYPQELKEPYAAEDQVCRTTCYTASHSRCPAASLRCPCSCFYFFLISFISCSSFTDLDRIGMESIRWLVDPLACWASWLAQL